MAKRFELTDKQWEFVKDLLPKGKTGTSKGGRPRADDRTLLNGMLWLLRTGAPWADLPERYGAKSTVYDRFREWAAAGVFERISLALDGAFDLGELQADDSWQIDSTVVRAHRSASGAPKKNDNNKS